MEITRERIEQLRDLAQNQKVDTCLVQEWEAVAIYDLALRALAMQSDKDTLDIAQQVDLTIAGHPAYRLVLSTRRFHMLAKEVLRLNGKEPWNGVVHTFDHDPFPSPTATPQ